MTRAEFAEERARFYLKHLLKGTRFIPADVHREHVNALLALVAELRAQLADPSLAGDIATVRDENFAALMKKGGEMAREVFRLRADLRDMGDERDALRASLAVERAEIERLTGELEWKRADEAAAVAKWEAAERERDRLRAAIADARVREVASPRDVIADTSHPVFAGYVSGIGAINAGVITMAEGWSRLLYALRRVGPTPVEATESGPIEPQTLVDMLSLVMDPWPSLDDVAQWTEEQEEKARSWAAAEMMAANDHDDVERLPMPAFLSAIRARAQSDSGPSSPGVSFPSANDCNPDAGRGGPEAGAISPARAQSPGTGAHVDEKGGE